MRLSGVASVLFTSLVVLIAAAPSFAASSATLSGTVTDSSGKVIPETRVTATNMDTNIDSSSQTDRSGLYVIPDLPPGMYRITVRKDGFATIVRPDVVLHVEDVIAMNFSMQVGSLAQTVTVESGAPVIELASSTIGGTIDQQSVVELPLNGRSWTDLATLQPGVSSIKALPAVSSQDRIGR